jgi:hypothetical protein
MEETKEGEPIPPVAQTVMLRVVSFMLSKASLILLLPIIIIASNVVIAQGTIFSSAMLLPLSLLVIFIIFYSRFRKKILTDFEMSLKKVKYLGKVEESDIDEFNLKK